MTKNKNASKDGNKVYKSKKIVKSHWINLLKSNNVHSTKNDVVCIGFKMMKAYERLIIEISMLTQEVDFTKSWELLSKGSILMTKFNKEEILSWGTILINDIEKLRSIRNDCEHNAYLTASKSKLEFDESIFDLSTINFTH